MYHDAEVLFFDLDDTLVVWQKTHFSALREAVSILCYESSAIEPKLITEVVYRVSKQTITDMNSGAISFEQAAEILTAELTSVGVDQRAARRLYPSYIDTFIRNLQSHDDCDVLQTLSQKYTLGIISDGPKEWQIRKLESTGLYSLFKTVICSSEFRVCKPDKKLFDEACKRAGAEPCRSTMVGNNLFKDVIGAENAGLHGIWLNRDNEPKLDTQWNGAVIHSLRDLLER